MRLRTLLLFGLTLFGCEEEVDDCPDFWMLDKAQVSATAIAANGVLALEVQNPESPNAISLEKNIEVTDFELTLELQQMESDTLNSPQFRLEVFDIENSEEKFSGIAIQHNVFYCYVGNASPDNTDNRLVDFDASQLRISMTNDTLSCSAMVNGVFLEVRDKFVSEQIGVKMVFGTTTVGSGSALAVVDNFRLVSDVSVISDDFSCRSW